MLTMANCGTTQVKFQLRRDTFANWITKNPVLALGEPSVVSDTGQMKVGDGYTTWINLPYVGNGASIIFDGGDPFQTYSQGPVLDCGTIY
jgi:hypothetical protein